MANDEKVVKRGRGGKYNFPSTVEPEEPEVVRAALGSVLYWYKRGNGSPVKSDTEIEDRIQEYLTTCYQTGERMTVEKMALALGITRKTLWEWENATDKKSNLIKRAKDTIAAYDADMVTSGRMNPVPYIFRAKNYYGMTDQQDIVISPSQPLGAEMTADEIAEKLELLPD